MGRLVGGNSPGRSRIEWHRLERGVLVGLLAQAVLTMAAFVLGWIGFLLFLCVTMVEVLLISVLTSLLYPSRGRRRVGDAIKSILACAFTGVFIVPMYLGAAGSGGDGTWSERLVGALGLAPGPVAVALLLLVLRLGTLWFHARDTADPRYTWGRDAMRDGAVLMVSLFLACFGAFLALMATMPLHFVFGARAVDVSFGLMLVSIITGLSCVAGTMTETELREIVGNPYLD